MVTKKANIKQGGIFKKGRVLVTNILKNGDEGDVKAYTVAGKVKITPMEGKFVLDFNSPSGTSGGVTSRGTVSGRVYTRKMSIVVDEYTIIED